MTDNTKFVKACIHEIQDRECKIRAHTIALKYAHTKILKRRYRYAINAEELSIASLKLAYAGWTGSEYDRDHA